jgi:hypothetical protein
VNDVLEQNQDESRSAEQYAEDVAAIQASFQDFKNGERGTVAGEHSAELRREFGVSQP